GTAGRGQTESGVQIAVIHVRIQQVVVWNVGDVVEIAFSESDIEYDLAAGAVFGFLDGAGVRVHVSGDPTLRVRGVDVRIIGPFGRIYGGAGSSRERHGEFLDAEHADVSQIAAKLFGVLQDVGRRGERTGLTGEIPGPAHPASAIHMNEGVG